MKKFKFDNINYLQLHGTEEEMAYQHGKLLSNDIQDSAIQKLASKNQFMITQAKGILSYKIVQRMAIILYEKFLIPILSISLPKQEKMKLKAISKGAQISYKSLLLAFYQADGLMILSRLSLMKYLFFKFPKSELPGCSSAVVNSTQTEDSTMLVMRNQDYPIVGKWEKSTLVANCTPTDNSIPYMFISSAGLHTAGLTAMNKCGITVAVHAHFGKDISLKGLPIFCISEKIVKNSKCLKDAEKIINESKTHANWTIVVTSSHEDQAIAFEITPKTYKKRYLKNGILTHTNFFQNSDLNLNEALISGARHDDDHARIKQMKKIISSKKNRVTVEDMVSICGNHEDPHSNSKKVFGNTLSVITTVKSVIFAPETFTAYVSTRNKTPVGIGDFACVTEEVFSMGKQPKVIKNPNTYENNFLKELEIYYNSYIEGQMKGNYANALNILTEISGKKENDPHVNLQCAFLAIKLGKYKKSLNYLNCVETKMITPHLRNFHGHIYELLNRKLNIDSEEQAQNPNNIDRCQRITDSIKRRNDIKQVSENIMIDMQFPEPIEY